MESAALASARPVRLHEEVIINRIRGICRCLAGLPRRASVSLASAAAAPTVLATSPPLPPGWNKHPPLPAHPSSPVSWLSFPRVIDVPFETCVAALESWQRTGQDGELHIGQSLLRWPIEHGRDRGTCRIEVGLARGPLRPPLRMRLDIDRWSPSSARTALELIPCQRVRPTAAYFRSGHLLLDSLSHALRQAGPRDEPGTHPAELTGLPVVSLR